MTKSLADMQYEIGCWGDETFPREDKITTVYGLANHIQDEAEEIYGEAFGMSEGEDTEDRLRLELADLFILAFQMCHELGIDIEKAIDEKMDINYDREWQEPDENGVVRHK